MIADILTAALLLPGAIFGLLAAIGIVRLPDLYTRMQAAAKAGTLGVGCSVLAVAVHFGELGITTRALLVVGFLFLTAPVAAHMIGRAAYRSGVPLWEGSVQDELFHRVRSKHAAAGSTASSQANADPETEKTKKR